MSTARHIRTNWTAAAIALAMGAALSGCTSTIDYIPTAAGGLPEGVPQRSSTPPAYPAVHDMPPPRQEAPLTLEQRKRAQDELAKTRERYAPAAPEATGATPRNP